MGKLLHLKGEFSSQKHAPTRIGTPKLPKGGIVSITHIETLRQELQELLNYWGHKTIIQGALVSVYYRSVIAKSNRLRVLLTQQREPKESLIRGAKFGRSGQHQFHIFTYYVTLENIHRTINVLIEILAFCRRENLQTITNTELDKIDTEGVPASCSIAKGKFCGAVVDCYYVASFTVDEMREPITEGAIISIYDTGVDTKQLMTKLGISIVDHRIIERTTLQLTPPEIAKLQQQAPYLIAMQVTDFSQLSRETIYGDYMDVVEEVLPLPSPTNEPVVGVIDTHFDERVYFHEWVDYVNCLDTNIELSEADYHHGTAVASIIVDGPRANPALEDGCGHFRVKHFGVATTNGFSSFGILQMIRSIVSSNPDIKVWNVSLGSTKEVPLNFISPEGAELDCLQTEFDVLFVVAGSNDNEQTGSKRIGAPADSINSVVVNAVNNQNQSASYTRTGPVLSFFNKPDVSCFGGDGTHYQEKMAVCMNTLGATYTTGTSFAAPWITRKLAYLIHILGLDRNTAKALLIDAAAGWSRCDDVSHRIGYGVVPTHIRDVVESKDDEIRFILTGRMQEYYTYSYRLPVPIVDGKQPYWARATLVYFPECHRNQGVDYTSTEMDLQLGRMKTNKKNPSKLEIYPINNNQQSSESIHHIYEEDAREQYRKWDNVKHIAERITTRKSAKKVYLNGMWGIRITTKERTTGHSSYGLPFSVVITLKAMDEQNRVQEFVDMCHVLGWVVNTIDIDERIAIHEEADVDIVFDD